MKPFEQFQGLPPITCFRVGCDESWQLIYIDGQLFHFHDQLPLEEFLAKVGVPDQSGEIHDQQILQQYLDEVVSDIDWCPPSTFEGFMSELRRFHKAKLQTQIKEAEAKLAEAAKQLDDLDG